jgi:hypothetical protein
MTRDRFVTLANTPGFTALELDELIAAGQLEECPACGKLSAYSWQIAEYADPDTDDDAVPRPGIAHIPRCSGFEWQCGHCLTDWTTEDSPINHPCYTHAEV